jgi:hypothetical protein
MPLQNRVTPFGRIVALADRGSLMGNRGCLHDATRNVTRLSARPAWVTCQLEWKGIHRQIMSPGKYTELFFLDEATALAAGHRPCSDCRSERLKQFQQAWACGVEGRATGVTPVSRIDPVMQADRWVSRGVQRTFQASTAELPDGVMVELPCELGTARLKWHGQLFRWSSAGYSDPIDRGPSRVTVLTPACTVKTIEAGFSVEPHLSLNR